MWNTAAAANATEQPSDGRDTENRGPPVWPEVLSIDVSRNDVFRLVSLCEEPIARR
ncbi:hypothetical protein [Actinoplanes siamensis]|uniref:hypothetical protein n=1 Tax=Actinoplanes siamensis TaxID=1223317 RepID=UPI001943FF74|nr:hypothetical protein [Actinoplanes siamensis]